MDYVKQQLFDASVTPNGIMALYKLCIIIIIIITGNAL